MNIQPEVLQTLNAVLCQSLTLINQTYLHARMARHLGYDGLAQREKKVSILEMKRTDALLARIFLLGGMPNLQLLDKLLIGENIPELLECDVRAEERRHDAVCRAIGICERAEDFVSRDLLENVLHFCEERLDDLEAEIELIDAMGLQDYLQRQTETADT